jgi:hypothetical protein
MDKSTKIVSDPDEPDDIFTIYETPCCACGEIRVTRNVMMIEARAPASAAGKGWGCAVCGLAPDGAIAVVCDPCLEARRPITRVCAGYMTDAGRVDRASLSAELFEHDRSRHADEPW